MSDEEIAHKLIAKVKEINEILALADKAGLSVKIELLPGYYPTLVYQPMQLILTVTRVTTIFPPYQEADNG